jgi:hypothetical protein
MLRERPVRLDIDRFGERLRTGLAGWSGRQSGQRGLWLGLAICALLWLAIVVFCQPFGAYPYGSDQDARAYWLAWNSDPYAGATVGVPGAYLYSPAFLQLIGPLRAMSWPGFVAVWSVILLVATAYLAGPELLLIVVLLASSEIWGGNISLLLALAIVAGFRWPAAWAFVLLTKVSPGVGLLWFAVRREWSHLGVALGATLGFVALSYILGTREWSAWVAVLVGNVSSTGTWAAIPIPLLIRLPIAVAVIVWAARGDRRWALPIGCFLAMPVLWYGSLTILAASLPFLGRRGWNLGRPLEWITAGRRPDPSSEPAA